MSEFLILWYNKIKNEKNEKGFSMEKIRVNAKKEEVTISFDLMNEFVCMAVVASQFEVDKKRTTLSERYKEIAMELHNKLDAVGYYDDVKATYKSDEDVYNDDELTELDVSLIE